MPHGNKRIYLSPPDVGTEERQFVEHAFDSNWIAPLGPEVDAFERELSAYCRVSDVAVLSSGTAAIHLGLCTLGVGPGDLVLVPSLTFIASANPALYLGAEVAFVDSERGTWNICPECLREAIEDCIRRGKRPSAVIVVDLYGMPAQYMQILPLCAEYGIPVLVDAAEALGATYDGKPTSSLGALGILSFNGNKIITTSGGGALLSHDKSLVAKARFLSTQARDPAVHYQHSQMGFNYRMSNILAAIGRAQLKDIERRVARRREHFLAYKQALSSFGVGYSEELPGSVSNRWLSTFILPESRFSSGTNLKVIAALDRENIEARPIWKPLHKQPLFASNRFYGSRTAESIFEYGVCLPSGSSLSDSERARVIETVVTELRAC